MNDNEKLPPDLNDLDRRLRSLRPTADQPTLDRIKARTLGGQRSRRNAGARRGGLALVLAAGTMVATTGVALGLGGFFVTGKTASLTGHGKNAAHHALVVGAAGPSSINRSSFAPSSGQGAGNLNLNGASLLAPTTGDTFIIGPSYTSNNQGINNTQVAVQGGIGGGGTTIINDSNYAPTINQGATNVNCNGATGVVYCGATFIP